MSRRYIRRALFSSVTSRSQPEITLVCSQAALGKGANDASELMPADKRRDAGAQSSVMSCRCLTSERSE